MTSLHIKLAAKAAAQVALGAVMLAASLPAQDLVARTEGKPEDALKSSDTDKSPYNKHDFNGLWARNPQVYGLPRCPECGDPGPWPRTSYGYHGTPPPRTPEGLKRFEMNKPARGIEKDSDEAKRRTDLDIGLRRAIFPAYGNDPEARCEPLGLARLITFSGGGATMEMIQTPTNDRILQRFEWTWDNREIWMDGRKLPKVDDYLPRYNGYSVAKWEGDTLVVTSTGFDDRQWLDQYGYPVSDKAVLEERWERPSKNRLRVQLTLIDPANYTQPWKSSYSKIAVFRPMKRISTRSGIAQAGKQGLTAANRQTELRESF